MPARGQKQTDEAKAKISAARVANFLASLEDRPDAPEFKRCTKCGEKKPLAAFFHRKRKLKSGVIVIYPEMPCRACKTAYEKARHERLVAEGKFVRPPYRSTPRRRRQKRESMTSNRRAKGIEPRNFQIPPKPDGDTMPTLDAVPIKRLIERELKTRGRGDIARASGISERRINGLLRDEYDGVSLATVDAILHGLGVPEEMHLLYPDHTIGYHYILPEK